MSFVHRLGIVKEKCTKMYTQLGEKFQEQFGFAIGEVTFARVVNYLHAPKDSSSLAVTRILFGMAMLCDVPAERGGAALHRRWDPQKCHFPLFPFVTALSVPYMALVYATLWFGALGIALGYKYRISAPAFTICHWYLLIIDKSFWNNHSYLFGLVALLLTFTQANCYWSLDVYLNPSLKRDTVPYWNYFLLKYQFFILYFMAGMKKSGAEWLTGYSVQGLSQHWVFMPFKPFLSESAIDYLVVHWFIFAFDLTVAVWMMWSPTRNVAMFFCALFHLMNSRLFSIGMFPWVCLATMPLFYPFDWPKTVINTVKNYCSKLCSIIRFHIRQEKSINDAESENYVGNKLNPNNDDDDTGDDNVFKDNDDDVIDGSESDTKSPRDVAIDSKKNGSIHNIEETQNHSCAITLKHTCLSDKLKGDETVKNANSLDTTKSKDPECISMKKRVTTYIIFFHIFMQLFLPYSHFITKGYNNWTNGLYGYSWDMMVHSWHTNFIVVKMVDNNLGKDFYVDPATFTFSDRWARHGDMLHQYAHCIKDKYIDRHYGRADATSLPNISMYIDVWVSMNGRFTQRLFDSKVDLLKVSWSPFREVSYLMPLLDEALHWREDLAKIADDVMSWSENSDVIFLADFPGYDIEKFTPLELENVTLTVLQGPVAVEHEARKHHLGHSHYLYTGDRIQINSGLYHKVINIGTAPAYYMYTFVNTTEYKTADNKNDQISLPIFHELQKLFTQMIVFAKLVVKNTLTPCLWKSRCE